VPIGWNTVELTRHRHFFITQKISGVDKNLGF